MKKLSLVLFWVCVLFAAAMFTSSCAHGPKPAPCANVEDCNNPADLPPLNDDSPINLTGMGRKNHDGGSDK